MPGVFFFNYKGTINRILSSHNPVSWAVYSREEAGEEEAKPLAQHELWREQVAPLSTPQASKLSFVLLPLNPDLRPDTPETKVTRTSPAAEPRTPILQQWLVHIQVQFPWFHPLAL